MSPIDWYFSLYLLGDSPKGVVLVQVGCPLLPYLKLRSGSDSPKSCWDDADYCSILYESTPPEVVDSSCRIDDVNYPFDEFDDDGNRHDDPDDDENRQDGRDDDGNRRDYLEGDDDLENAPAFDAPFWRLFAQSNDGAGRGQLRSRRDEILLCRCGRCRQSLLTSRSSSFPCDVPTLGAVNRLNGIP